MNTINKQKNHTFIYDGRIIKVNCTKEELKKYIQKIKRKCKDLKPLQGFKGEIK
tara:strand:- start:1604 stop:1765 length:162 start_codon:yes stop_codon:yes gene_type:complete